MLLTWRSEYIKWTKTSWFRIIDLDEDKEHKSFEIQQIAGIPEDKTLSDKTAEAISNGQQLLDYSDEDNKYTYQAYFSAYEMNPAVTEES